MTTLFGGPGFGGGGTMPPTREAKALAAIDSRTQTFVNQDFVRNIQWLNNSVDTLSAYTQKLQQGVDAANQNALEQLQGIIADLIVIFAGGTPTGIDLGDLKYIFQALGTLLGINPDTVFPLNLIEAAGNLFRQFIVPLPQFTDIIFDAMELWLERFGFSDEAIEAVREFNDAVTDLYFGITDFTSGIIPALNRLLKQIGLGFGWLDLTLLRRLVDDLRAKIQKLLSGPRDFLLNILSILITTVFKAMTWLVNLINPRNLMRSLGLESLGPDLAPNISDLTTIWQVGSNPNTQWVFDATQWSPGTPLEDLVNGRGQGSFRTIGNAYGKRILTQGTETCTPGETFAFSGWLRWQGVATHQNQWGPCIVFYAGLNEIEQQNIDAPSDRETDGGWLQVGRNIIVPNNVDGFKLGYRCGAQVGAGTIWGGTLTCSKLSLGLEFSLFNLFVPWNIFKNIPSLGDLSIGGVNAWLKTFLTSLSPLNANNIYGFIPDNLLAKVPIASLFAGQTELLMHPGFDNLNTLEGQGVWHHDENIGHSKFGSVYVDCDGTLKELYNRNIIPVEAKQGFTWRVWVRWQALGGFSTNPACIVIQEYADDECEEFVAEKTMNFAGGTGPNSGWQQMTSNYTVPQGVSMIKYKLQVKASATSGRVWFDDASGKRTNLLGWNLIDSLESAWSALISALRGWTFNFGDGLSGLWESITDIAARFRNLLPTGWFDASWLTNIFNIPSLSDLSVPGVLTLVDNITTGIFGWAGFGFRHEDSKEALESIRIRMEQHSTALESFLAKESSGFVIEDNFRRNGNNLDNSKWSQMYAGSSGRYETRIDRGAVWNTGSGITHGTFIWIGNAPSTQTQSNYQDVGLVLNSANHVSWAGSRWGSVEVVCRFQGGPNNANDFVKFRVEGNREWFLMRYNGGIQRQVANGKLSFTPNAGTFVRIMAGDMAIGDQRIFRCFVGLEKIYDWPDVGQVTTMGPTARGVGFGASAYDGLFTSQQAPAGISLFVGKDQ